MIGRERRCKQSPRPISALLPADAEFQRPATEGIGVRFFIFFEILAEGRKLRLVLEVRRGAKDAVMKGRERRSGGDKGERRKRGCLLCVFWPWVAGCRWGFQNFKIIFIVYLAFGGALVVFGRGFCARWFKLRFIFIQKNYL